ncbi:MAG TPA: PBP1A family penicillin-binding protein [Candidatus Pullichristensenella excrementigallinarum]|uniref:Penicillin-binding protein 1A n=1 Tax=Candidatus Pullichristensenella excrementigallinarum TaxID=2840907 RepID=A0A9D1IBS4_9FIRM|nr:PBP1A family penicillin-binding protein [Candidatus Pullichristensenella excrementigallinarum]
MRKKRLSRKAKWWIFAAILGALILLLIWELDLPNWQKLDLDRLNNLAQSTVVYASDVESVGNLYGGENRVLVSIEEIPLHVQQAFIAAEDLRFYEHNGVDVVRIFGALWHDIKTMSLQQGASTITQQLIKLTHLTSDKTLSRKVQEAFLAMQLEKELSKEEILECYLNVVYFGNGAYGIESASKAYFGKSVSDLTLEQGALLAGIIKAPSNYAPHLEPENALERRNMILDTMAEAGFIDSEEAERAKATPLEIVEQEEPVGEFGWYMDAVMLEAQDALNISAEQLLSGGYHIYTALDPDVQKAAETLFQDGANFPDPAEDGTPAQAAMAAMDVRNGEIVALIGGRSYDVRLGLNRATSIQRQPGSAVKPVSTYAAAMETGNYLPTSFVSDEKREFAGGYSPGNASGKYYGIVTLREALSRSLNVATVDLADRLGIPAIREQMEKFGLPLSDADQNLALSLGSMTDGVSPVQLLSAYGALANQGMRSEAHLIREIRDASGEIVYRADAAKRRALSAEAAYLVTDMLRTAAETGSAKALSGVNADVAAKTGTVGMEGSGNRDAWTVAYTPKLAVAVWMGFDQPDASHKLPDWAGGSSYPAQLCAKFFSGIDGKWLQGAFHRPSGLREALVDALSLEQDHAVFLADTRTPAEYVETELFHLDDVPQTVSGLWDAPESVQDLQLASRDGEIPVLQFTSRDANAEYLLLRKTGTQTEWIATLQGAAGEKLEYADLDADLSDSHSYSVLPRHKLLYEYGTLLTGKESDAVQYNPSGVLNRVASWLEGEEEPTEPEVEIEEGQSLFG